MVHFGTRCFNFIRSTKREYCDLDKTISSLEDHELLGDQIEVRSNILNPSDHFLQFLALSAGVFWLSFCFVIGVNAAIEECRGVTSLLHVCFLCFLIRDKMTFLPHKEAFLSP